MYAQRSYYIKLLDLFQINMLFRLDAISLAGQNLALLAYSSTAPAVATRSPRWSKRMDDIEGSTNSDKAWWSWRIRNLQKMFLFFNSAVKFVSYSKKQQKWRKFKCWIVERAHQSHLMNIQSTVKPVDVFHLRSQSPGLCQPLSHRCLSFLHSSTAYHSCRVRPHSLPICH